MLSSLPIAGCVHLQVACRDDEGLHYTVSVDLYSAGVVMCELAARHLLVEVGGSVPSPTHPDAEYTSASSMIRDGLAVLRSLPGALATGGSAHRAYIWRSLRPCLVAEGVARAYNLPKTQNLAISFDGSLGCGLSDHYFIALPAIQCCGRALP
jgi:hypothetical protein